MRALFSVIITWYILLQEVDGWINHQRNKIPCTISYQQYPFSGSQRLTQLYFDKISNEKNDFTQIVPENSSSTNIVETNSNISKWQSYMLLNFIAILWGSQHVVIKSSLDVLPSTSLLNAWRFALSTLLFIPAISSAIKRKSASFPAGCELGLYTFLGFAFQAIGLETTTASRSAFLLYLNVKFVPILAGLLFKRKISGLTWLSAILAFSGTALLSSDGGGINVGDLWCIGAALASAMFILRLESFSKIHDAAELNGISFATVTTLCASWVLGDITSGHISMSSSTPLAVDGSIYNTLLSNNLLSPILSNPLPLLYLGIVSTAICNYLQTIGQRDVPAEKAAIIYSMDPVYGAIFSYYFLHEEFGWKGFAGAGLIICGIIVSSFAGNKDPKKEEISLVD